MASKSTYLIPLEPIEGPLKMTMPVTFTSDDVWIRRRGGSHFRHLGGVSGRIPVGFHTGRHCLNFTGLVSVAQ